MKKRGISGFQNQDDQVFVPISTAQKLLLGINHVNMIRAKIDFPENIEQCSGKYGKYFARSSRFGFWRRK